MHKNCLALVSKCQLSHIASGPTLPPSALNICEITIETDGYVCESLDTKYVAVEQYMKNNSVKTLKLF